MCELCWLEEEGRYAHKDHPEVPVGLKEALEAWPRKDIALISVRMPSVVNGQLEQCCFCGQATIIGIYVRRDPKGLDCQHL